MLKMIRPTGKMFNVVIIIVSCVSMLTFQKFYGKFDLKMTLDEQ